MIVLNEIQLDLFDDDGLNYHRVYEKALCAVVERCVEVQKEYMDAWVIGSHGSLQDMRERLWQHPDPLLRLGYRHGLEDYEKFEQSGLTARELRSIEERILSRLDYVKRRSVVYSGIGVNDIVSSSGKPYGTEGGVTRYLDRNGLLSSYRVIKVKDCEKGAGWVARPKGDFL